MKKLLCVFILFTTSTLIANDNNQFYFESVACESGVKINPQVLKKNPLPTGLSLSKDLSELTVYKLNNIDDSTTENNFSLRIMGKDAYLAIPEELTGEMNNFFIRTNSTSSVAQIYRKETKANLCGNGLVIITFVKSAL